MDPEHLKSALYIRVSTHWQVDKDSLPLQRDDLIKYSEYVLGIHDYEIFEDAGYSAKNTDRPAFQNMLQRLRTGEFSHLIVWKIDRISRNLLDFSELYAELKKLGITFISKNEQFDTSNAMGEAMLKIILVFAELERNMTSERVSAVMLSRAENGQWNGGKIPFGYDYAPASCTFTINPDEARVVNEIYNLYLHNHSLLYTAQTLNDNGIRTRSGNAWSPVTVSKILKNPFYVGDYRYNYHNESHSNGNTSELQLKPPAEWVTIENHHPAIITRELQSQIIYMLENNRRNSDSGKSYTRKHIHIFAGLLYCGNCNSQMQSTQDRPRSNGYRPSIYACARKRRFSDCDNKYISDITLAPFVLNYAANILKAQRTFGKSTRLDTFERKLLRGSTFADIQHIDPDGLSAMYNLLKNNTATDIFTSAASAPPPADDTFSKLQAERHKTERALSRLKSLYLYSEESLPEKDFIVEQSRLTSELEQIDKKLKDLQHSNPFLYSMTDSEYSARASLYIMQHELLSSRYVNFQTLIQKIEPSVIKEFVNSIIKKIVIYDGRITSIQFLNGITHKFLYK